MTDIDMTAAEARVKLWRDQNNGAFEFRFGSNFQDTPIYQRLQEQAAAGVVMTRETLLLYLAAKDAASGIMRIGVSGDAGSFSHKAALGWIAENGIIDPTWGFLVEIDPVLGALGRGEIDLGIFPIHNTSVGPIDQALEAMSRYNFVIVGKMPLLVEHCLLAREGVTSNEIQAITSMQPAIDQCERRLHRDWRHVTINSYPDTAKAAQDLANGTLDRTTAVIASFESSRIYGLKVLERPFQDNRDNMTGFLVVKART